MRHTQKRVVSLAPFNDESVGDAFRPARGLLFALPVCAIFWIGVAYRLFAGR